MRGRAQEDFERDARGADQLTYELFFNSLFEASELRLSSFDTHLRARSWLITGARTSKPCPTRTSSTKPSSA